MRKCKGVPNDVFKSRQAGAGYAARCPQFRLANLEYRTGRMQRCARMRNPFCRKQKLFNLTLGPVQFRGMDTSKNGDGVWCQNLVFESRFRAECRRQTNGEKVRRGVDVLFSNTLSPFPRNTIFITELRCVRVTVRLCAPVFASPFAIGRGRCLQPTSPVCMRRFSAAALGIAQTLGQRFRKPLPVRFDAAGSMLLRLSRTVFSSHGQLLSESGAYRSCNAESTQKNI